MQRRRRMTAVAIGVLSLIFVLLAQRFDVSPPLPSLPADTGSDKPVSDSKTTEDIGSLAKNVLDTLPVKGRAPKTGYARTQFGDGWQRVGGCDTRNIILRRDMSNVAVDDDCKVMSGELADPYTGIAIRFRRGADTSSAVQIDHVVALSNAWQTGAQQLTLERRIELANDPLELLAVDGDANQAKGDGDAATWLPPNKSFRCQYVARQIAVKKKYDLWVTAAEKDAMVRVLAACATQQVPLHFPDVAIKIPHI